MTQDTPPFISLMSRPLARRLRGQRVSIAVERVMAALTVAVMAAFGLVALLLSDTLSRLPRDWHAVALAFIVSLVLAAFVYGIAGVRWPSRDDAVRRLELGIPHRPLSALADTLATGLTSTPDPLQSILWQRHVATMTATALQLRWRPPSLTLSLFEKRTAVLVGIAVSLAVVSGWGDLAGRWQRSLTIRGVTQAALVAEMWLTPPTYTGLPVIHRSTASAEAGKAIVVPEGATLVVLLSGGREGLRPRLTLAGQTLPMSTEKADDGGETYRLTTTLAVTPNPGILRLSARGRLLADWPLSVVTDQPPTVAFGPAVPEPKTPEAKTHLLVPVVASDDFGLKRLSLDMILDPETDARRLEVDLAGGTNGSPVTEAKQTAEFDLSADPWAGLPVSLRWEVEDSKGQIGHSERVQRVLPERTFINPLAARLAADRHGLYQHLGERHRDIVHDLDEASRQLDGFQGDTTVFLSLRVAAYRLAIDSGKATDRSVAALLWSLALRLEDGGLDDAKSALKAASAALDKALATPGADVKAATDAVRLALQRYRAQLGQQLARQLGTQRRGGQSSPLAMDRSLLKGMSTLDQDLQRLSDLAALGDKAAAQALRERIEKELEALRSATPLSPEAVAQAMRWGKAVEVLVQQERALLADTFASEKGDDGARPPESLSAQQDEIRNQLDDLMAEIGAVPGGKIPDSLGQAERAMHATGDDLQVARFDSATVNEGVAIEALTKGKRQAMMTALGGNDGPVIFLPGGSGDDEGVGGEANDEEGNDPLGRPPNNGGALPSNGEVNHARDLLGELRRRMGEADRPPPERDYLQRLLDGF